MKKKFDMARRVDGALQKLFDRADGMRVQLRAGRHASLKREILKQIETMPQGAEMLKAARENGVSITVLRPKSMPGASGKLTRYRRAQAVVFIANTGDAVEMALTLWHELRHVVQMRDWGRLEPGHTGRLRDTQRMHVLSMMIEADAYTAQTVMAVQAKKAGDARYLEKLLARKTAAFQSIARLLEKTPYESFADDGIFARTVFSHVMQNGLGGYSRTYQKNYASAFNKAATVKSFRNVLSGMKTPAPFKPSEDITRIYKSDLLGSTSIDALLALHQKAQPQKLTEVLALIDKTVEAAPALTQEQYQAARAEILERLPKPYAPQTVSARTRLKDAFLKAVRKSNPLRLWRKDGAKPKVTPSP